MKGNLDISAGSLHIRLTSSDNKLLANLSQLFLSGSNGDRPILIDLDEPVDDGPPWSEIARTDPKALLAYILSQIYEKFQGCLWLDASCLIKDGRTILIAGPSHSGKTTLSLAAAVGQTFKIISEDITFFDTAPIQVHHLTLPLSLRTGTIERIEQATGAHLPAPLFGEWVYLPELYFAGKDKIESLHTVVVLEELVLARPLPLAVVPIAATECLKRLLPLSNALRLENTVANVSSLLNQTKTFSMTGGTLQERLHWLSAASL